MQCRDRCRHGADHAMLLLLPDSSRRAARKCGRPCRRPTQNLGCLGRPDVRWLGRPFLCPDRRSQSGRTDRGHWLRRDPGLDVLAAADPLLHADPGDGDASANHLVHIPDCPGGDAIRARHRDDGDPDRAQQTALTGRGPLSNFVRRVFHPRTAARGVVRRRFSRVFAHGGRDGGAHRCGPARLHARDPRGSRGQALSRV